MVRFELPVQNFLITKLRENFPEINLREGSAFRDMLVKPATLLFQPFRDQLQILKRNVSISNFALMLDDEFDALMSNFFVERREGDLASGIVRVFYSQAQDSLINTTTSFFTEDGRSYNPTAPIAITAAEMQLNIEGNLFYVDVAVQSVERGVNNNAEIGEVAFVSGGPSGIVQVTNNNPITAGTDRETNTRLYSRAKSSITVRDLVTKRAITAVLLDTFTSIRELQVFGFGDPEMERDLTPVPLAPSEIASSTCDIDNEVADGTDGEATVSTNVFTSASAQFLSDGVRPGMRVTVSGTNVIDDIIEDVIDENTLQTTTNFSSSPTGATWFVNDDGRRTLVDSSGDFIDLGVSAGMPITVEISGDDLETVVADVFSSTVLALASGVPPTEGDQTGVDYTITSQFNNVENIHTGGKVDVYLDTSSLGENDLLVQVPADLKVWINRIVQDGEVVSGETTLTTEDYDFLANGVTLDDKLELLTGPNVGVYEIDTVSQKELDVTVAGGWARDEKGTRFRIIRSFYVDGDPFEIPVINGVSGKQVDPGTLEELADLGVGNISTPTIVDGANGEGVTGSDILTDNSVDFISLGVEEGMRLVMPVDLTDEDDTLGRIIQVIDSNNIQVEPWIGTGTWTWSAPDFTGQAYVIQQPPPADFTLISENPDTRYSPFQDTYFLFDSQWVGSFVRITYSLDSTVLSAQDFADSDDERVVAADIIIKRAWPAFVDIVMDYRGSIEEVDLEAILADFIDTTLFGDSLEKSDIIAYIYSFNVNFAVVDFVWSATVVTNENESQIVTDANALEIPRLAHFIARNIDLTKTGE